MKKNSNPQSEFSEPNLSEDKVSKERFLSPSFLHGQEKKKPAVNRQGSSLSAVRFNKGLTDEILRAIEEVIKNHIPDNCGIPASRAQNSDLSGHENIVGVSVREKISSKFPTGKLGVTILVKRKFHHEKVCKTAFIPKEITAGNASVQTDVVAVGTIRPHLGYPCGRMIGNSNFSVVGTLGALVRVRTPGGDKLCILSNNHVLANSNQGQKGQDILAKDPDALNFISDLKIGELEEYPIIDPNGLNVVDAALAWTSPSLVSPEQTLEPAFGQLSFPVDPEPIIAVKDMIVRKVGCFSGVTLGRVIGVSAMSPNVPYPAVGPQLFTADFGNQIEIQGLDGQPFSIHGDSGALVCEHSTNRPLGLLLGGSGAVTMVNPIGAVLDTLSQILGPCELVTSLG